MRARNTDDPHDVVFRWVCKYISEGGCFPSKKDEVVYDGLVVDFADFVRTHTPPPRIPVPANWPNGVAAIDYAFKSLAKDLAQLNLGYKLRLTLNGAPIVGRRLRRCGARWGMLLYAIRDLRS